MNYRPLGRTGWRVSDISFGAWAIAGNWGHVSERALAALNKAVESGVESSACNLLIALAIWSQRSV